MNDGSYYAKDRAVFRRPIDSAKGTTMGFAVCELCDGVDDGGAQEIANALNQQPVMTFEQAEKIVDKTLPSIASEHGWAWEALLLMHGLHGPSHFFVEEARKAGFELKGVAK